MNRAVTLIAWALALSMALPVGASAQNAHEGPTWEMEPALDIPVVAIEAMIGFGWILSPQLAPPFCGPSCDPDSVWGIDRFAAGRYSEEWGLAGDLGIITMLVGSATLLAIDEGVLPALSDAVIIGEAVAGAIALSILTNMSTRRPRPHAYGTESPLEDRESGKASLSFFSGHTAGSFAAATSLFVTLRERHPESSLPFVVLAVGLAAASFVGAARILAGQHFLTDVLAGAVVGSGLGILVPSLHQSRVRIGATALEGGAGLTLQIL